MTSNVFLKVFCFSVLYLDWNSNTYFFIPLSILTNSSEILQEQANSQDILSLATKINNVKWQFQNIQQNMDIFIVLFNQHQYYT